MTNIIHISDLHFGSENWIAPPSEIVRALRLLLESISDQNIHFVISGDITFKANSTGYTLAQGFFNDLIEAKYIKRENIIICPGNHDIMTSELHKFSWFDSFSYSIRLDKKFTFMEGNSAVYKLDNVAYLVLNSAFKLNPEFGLVDIESARSLILANQELSGELSGVKIAILHHHLLNKFETDISALRNAYDLLILLDEFKFNYIFHGHQHFNQVLPLGRSSIHSFGVRSFSYNSRCLNGINHYKVKEDNSLAISTYIYAKDGVSKGHIGVFKPL